jgi:hypothetical protein
MRPKVNRHYIAILAVLAAVSMAGSAITVRAAELGHYSPALARAQDRIL